MSKFSKFKEIFDIAAPIAGTFLPGGAGSILSKVSEGLNSHTQQASAPSAEAIRNLAEHDDEQDQAILALHSRLKALEEKV